MSVDLSVRNPNQSAVRAADALLRANAGMTISLLVAPAVGDSSDAGQVGANAPNFQELPISPVVFRKTSAALQKNGIAQYELLISAAAVDQQVSALELTSADALFHNAAGVLINGTQFVIQAHSISECLGHAYLYRLLVTESLSE